MAIKLHTHEVNGSGGAPNTYQILLPEPSVGMVRIPLLAAIQSDGPDAVKICHGCLKLSGNPFDPLWDEVWTPCLLWSVKLTSVAMVSGEFWLQVPAFPIVRGTYLEVEWADSLNGAHAFRTRSISVEVPASTYDWSRAHSLPMDVRLTTV